jgi:hypothetical protein
VLQVINYINAYGLGVAPSAAGAEGESSAVLDELSLLRGRRDAVEVLPSQLVGANWLPRFVVAETKGRRIPDPPARTKTAVALGVSERWQLASPHTRCAGTAASPSDRGARRSGELPQVDFETLELAEAISAIAAATTDVWLR